MTSEFATPSELMDQPELAVAADRVGQILAGWCVAASMFLMLGVF